MPVQTPKCSPSPNDVALSLDPTIREWALVPQGPSGPVLEADRRAAGLSCRREVPAGGQQG